MNAGKLKLELTDEVRNDINAAVRLKVATSNHTLFSSELFVTKEITLTDLPYGFVTFSFAPRGFHEITRTILFTESSASMKFAFEVDASKVRGIVAPRFNDLASPLRDVLLASRIHIKKSILSGAGLYTALDDLTKASLLNTYVKAVVTMLPSTGSVWGQFQR